MTASGESPTANDAIARRGLMLVLSSPSGAGKTTLSRRLLERRSSGRALGLGDDAQAAAGRESTAATITSSTPRSSTRWCEAGELLEWAEVFGHRYGTPRAPVEAALAAGRDVLFDIDWQGTQQLREKAERDLVSIFVLPPSIADLERRLRTPRAGFRRGDPRPHGQGGRRDEPLGGIRLCRDQYRHRSAPSPRCERSSRPSGSSASDRPAFPISFATAVETLTCRSPGTNSDARWRREEALARTAPLATPVSAVRRGQRLAERNGLACCGRITGCGYAHVARRELEAIAFAATQLAGGVLEAAVLDPLRRTVCAGKRQRHGRMARAASVRRVTPPCGVGVIARSISAGNEQP